MNCLKHLMLGGALVFSAHTWAQMYHGELRVLIADDFENKMSETFYQLKNGEDYYTLKLPEELNKKNLSTGTEVTIQGEALNTITSEKIIDVQSLTVTKTIKAIASTDVRKVLPIIVDFTNAAASSTVTPNVLDEILYTGTTSSLNAFQTSSFGQLSLMRDSNNDGKPDIYSIKLNYAVNDCNFDKWLTDARAAATAAGVNLSLYQHLMLVLPQNIDSCSWGGLGTLGCASLQSCWTLVRAYNPNGTYSKLTYSHELGHNLGMSHSATDLNNDDTVDDEYGDGACIMGVGDWSYYPQINAPHRDQLQWFNNYPQQISLNPTDGVYTLNPLEMGVNNNGLLTIKLTRNSTDNYYVSYRKPIGPFGPVSAVYANRISIHKTKAGDARSFFITSLGANQTFQDAAKNISVTAISVGGDTAQVKISTGKPSTQGIAVKSTGDTVCFGKQDSLLFSTNGTVAVSVPYTVNTNVANLVVGAPANTYTISDNPFNVAGGKCQLASTPNVTLVPNTYVPITLDYRFTSDPVNNLCNAIPMVTASWPNGCNIQMSLRIQSPIKNVVLTWPTTPGNWLNAQVWGGQGVLTLPSNPTGDLSWALPSWVHNGNTMGMTISNDSNPGICSTFKNNLVKVSCTGVKA